MFEISPYLDEFLIVVVTMFFALLSPGPDFAMILKQSVQYGKKTSIYTSIGLGIGVSVHVTYSILGIGFIISKSIVLFSIIKILGALYLIYIGYKSIKSKGFKLENTKAGKIHTMANGKSFIMGFLCNILNPKAALFFISLFTVVVNVDTPVYMQTLYGVFAILATIFWFSTLSLILSQNRVRRFFNIFGIWFDRFIGIVLISLGLKIAFLDLKELG